MQFNKSFRLSTALIVMCLAFGNTWAHDDNLQSEVDAIDWNLMAKQASTLSKLGYHPFLMPLIMKNRDTLDLSKAQVKSFMEWRSRYRVAMIHNMNQIIKKRLAFEKLALRQDTSNDVLKAKQTEILKLHRKVLLLQLSCRRTILENFTEEQWDSFKFVLSEAGFDVEAD